MTEWNMKTNRIRNEIITHQFIAKILFHSPPVEDEDEDDFDGGVIASAIIGP